MSWTTVITAAVAVYSAILSTYTHIARHRGKKRRLAVELSVGFGLYRGIGPGPTLLFLSASNPGSRTVSLNSPGLLLPNKKKLVFPFHLGSDVDFPYDLHEGKACKMWIKTHTLANELKKEGFVGNIVLRGYYLDALGIIHRSKPFEFEIDKWLLEL